MEETSDTLFGFSLLIRPAIYSSLYYLVFALKLIFKFILAFVGFVAVFTSGFGPIARFQSGIVLGAILRRSGSLEIGHFYSHKILEIVGGQNAHGAAATGKKRWRSRPLIDSCGAS